MRSLISDDRWDGTITEGVDSDIQGGVYGWRRAGWEAQAIGDHSVFISGRLHAQSFKWSTDCLVVVPSFRPSHAMHPATPAGSSILLNLVRWNPALSPTAAS